MVLVLEEKHMSFEFLIWDLEHNLFLKIPLNEKLLYTLLGNKLSYIS